MASKLSVIFGAELPQQFDVVHVESYELNVHILRLWLHNTRPARVRILHKCVQTTKDGQHRQGDSGRETPRRRRARRVHPDGRARAAAAKLRSCAPIELSGGNQTVASPRALARPHEN